MENDEEVTVEVQDEEQVDTVEETTTEDVVEVTETEEDALAKAQAEAAKYRRLFEKSQKPKEQTKPQATPANVEEVVLLANGMDEALLEQLKKVAAVNGTTLIKAQNDPIFVAVKEKFEREKKHEDASLPSTRGAGTVKVKKDFGTPGLSRDEHKKLVESM
jgi:16S rRNA G1207 methylase RsmC